MLAPRATSLRCHPHVLLDHPGYVGLNSQHLLDLFQPLFYIQSLPFPHRSLDLLDQMVVQQAHTLHRCYLLFHFGDVQAVVLYAAGGQLEFLDVLRLQLEHLRLLGPVSLDEFLESPLAELQPFLERLYLLVVLFEEIPVLLHISGLQINSVTIIKLVTMKVCGSQENGAPLTAIRKKNNEHVDIFNTKEAGHTVIRNDEPVLNENVFQKKIDSAYEQYEGTFKRPSSSYNKSNVTYQEGSYAFNQDWSSANQFSSKTLVNESATFGQDYHHMRRFQENSSSIFPCEDKKTPGMYKKNI